MKILKSLISAIMVLGAFAGFTSCMDHIDAPENAMQPPVATLKPNTSIYDLKLAFWDDAQNYAKEIGTRPDGSHYIVAGRVITSDYAGNIFKSIVIQDETAALPFSINTYNLFLDYRIGQEVVVDLTGLHIGKYNGLQQVGAPLWYEKGNCWEVSFMAPQLFKDHVQLNGLPEPSKVIAHKLASISDIPAGAEGLCRWQSQLVQLENVTFVPQVNEATGKKVTTFGVYKENFNQKLLLGGSELILRTSGYSSFYPKQMPTQACDVKLLLSYYGSDWQTMLIDYADITNIGTPTLPKGTQENPRTIDETIETINNGTAEVGWTMGYIVGTVAPEVETVTSNADIEWGATATLANTVVIGATRETRDVLSCIIVPLAQNSVMRKYVALKDNPQNLGAELRVFGTPGKYLGAFGITGNNGTASEFQLEGLELGGGQPTVYTETFKSGLGDWFIKNLLLPSQATYIWNHDTAYGYMKASAFVAGASYASNSWLVSPIIDLTQATGATLTFDHCTNKFPTLDDAKRLCFLQVSVDGGKWEKLTIPTWSDNASWTFANAGTVSLAAYAGKKIQLGFQYTSEDGVSGTWEVKNVTINVDGPHTATATTNFPEGGGTTGGTVTPEPEPKPEDTTKGKFNTFNSGLANVKYGTYENATGWKAVNANILSGSTAATPQNPYFAFLGGDGTLAVNLNGNTANPGSITSPTLTGGCGTLTFNYGFAYTEKKCKFTVNVLQAGKVVKTQTVEIGSDIKKQTVYEFSMPVNVTGDFSITITNDSPSAAAANGDRVAIWNLTW